MSEFDRIDDIVRELGRSATGAGVVLGPGDDAAILEIPAGFELVVSADTLIAGRHYPVGSDPELIAGRALGVSLSDLAAMGAEPRFVTVSLGTETLERDWAIGFGRGLARRAREYGAAVVGGNIARGPQHVAVTVHGIVPAGTALCRTNACEGDEIWVTGVIGHASSALEADGLAHLTFDDLEPGSSAMSYWNPPCRTPFAIDLRELATAAIDISDGLAADLAHIAAASRSRLSVELDAVPTSPALAPERAVVAGDDYELAFTAPTAAHTAVRALGERHDVPVTRIGRVGAETGVGAGVEWSSHARAIEIDGGYRHF